VKADKEHKRKAILDAGAEVMQRKGYHGTSVQEIVGRARVPKGSFYHYFRSKEDFVLAAMEHLSCDDIAGFEDALENEGISPRQRIIDTYTASVADIEATRDYSKGCFVGNMCQEMADTNAAVAEKAEYLFRRYTAPLARCIRKARTSGEIKSRVDPDKLAEAIFNSWEGAVLRMKSSRNSQPLNAFLDMLPTLLS
jgi:TetR/AcrR family transcriptional repressor of nem operon